MLTFSVSTRDHCRRFESWLRTLMPESPSGYARKLIKSGSATVNGGTAHPDTPLRFRDTITLKESAATVGHISAERPLFDILYEDSLIAMVNKPAGLPMHRTAEHEDNLVEFGQAYMGRRNTPCKLYPVNRLDRGTSGTVILAKSSTAAGIYGRHVKETGLDKLYLALTAGTPDDSGTISEPLDEKEAETRYRTLLSGDGCSLLAVTPVSGRLHQIRRHLSAIGYAIIGDKRYGGGDIPHYAGFALHSFRTLAVRPEATAVIVSAPLSDDFLNLCDARGISRDTLLEKVYQLHSLPEAS